MAAQDAAYFNPSAWSFRDSYYLFVGDTWNVPADDTSHISWVKTASAALRPYYVGNYINRESPALNTAVNGSFLSGYAQKIWLI